MTYSNRIQDDTREGDEYNNEVKYIPTIAKIILRNENNSFQELYTDLLPVS